ncbi:MAG: hypothetical protein AAGJ93_05435 [Bacteroidota bacterium]
MDTSSRVGEAMHPTDGKSSVGWSVGWETHPHSWGYAQPQTMLNGLTNRHFVFYHHLDHYQDTKEYTPEYLCFCVLVVIRIA